MTGDVPYYGGRLSPAQAYAASHPRPPAQPPPPPVAPVAPVAPVERRDPVEALDRLLETGVLTQQEYDDLRARTASTS